MKGTVFSKIDHFDLPARGRKVKKSIFSKINHTDLSARGRKVEKFQFGPPTKRLKR